jgi:hypothetical protein
VDGRRWAAAALLVATSACSLGPLESVDSVRRSREGDARLDVERPSLDEIFRDGEYDFVQAHPAAEKAFRDEIAKDPTVEETLEKAILRQVVDPEDRFIFTFAFVMGEEATKDPLTWDGFLVGASDTAGEDFEESTMDGVDVAFVETKMERTLLLNYAPDLIVMITSDLDVSRTELEDIGQYLLDARD